MEYENPEIPEGINTTSTHPLKNLAVLLGSLLVLLALGAWLLGMTGAYLAAKIPYSQELRLAEQYAEPVAASTPIERYLQQLADQVGRSMELPSGMKITVHYVDEGVDNAFATLGGNVFLYRGLLEKLPNENALAMLIAHEAAHVLHRDPIVSVGQNAAISVGLMVVLGDTGASGILGSAGLLTQLQFSRSMENKADEAGLLAVQRIYGHLGGALDLYRVLESISDANPVNPPAFFSTHPVSEARFSHLSELIAENGWSANGDVQALPESFSVWMTDR